MAKPLIVDLNFVDFDLRNALPLFEWETTRREVYESAPALASS